MLIPRLDKGLLLAAALMSAALSWAQTKPSLEGDLGLALYRTPPVTRTADRSTLALPYVYAGYGAWYGRVDTFGYKALPTGQGHLELAARVSTEGYRPSDATLDKRATPRPVGLGSFQETSIGAFFLYAFRDTVSGGTLIDLSYAAELGLGPVQVYPQAGVERRSARYAQHLYGISAAEALRSGLARHEAGHSVTPNVAIAVDYPLGQELKFTGQIRRRWLDRSMTDSPLVNTKTQTSGFLALTRSFK